MKKLIKQVLLMFIIFSTIYSGFWAFRMSHLQGEIEKRCKDNSSFSYSAIKWKFNPLEVSLYIERPKFCSGPFTLTSEGRVVLGTSLLAKKAFFYNHDSLVFHNIGKKDLCIEGKIQVTFNNLPQTIGKLSPLNSYQLSPKLASYQRGVDMMSSLLALENVTLEYDNVALKCDDKLLQSIAQGTITIAPTIRNNQGYFVHTYNIDLQGIKVSSLMAEYLMATLIPEKTLDDQNLIESFQQLDQVSYTLKLSGAFRPQLLEKDPIKAFFPYFIDISNIDVSNKEGDDSTHGNALFAIEMDDEGSIHLDIKSKGSINNHQSLSQENALQLLTPYRIYPWGSKLYNLCQSSWSDQVEPLFQDFFVFGKSEHDIDMHIAMNPYSKGYMDNISLDIKRFHFKREEVKNGEKVLGWPTSFSLVGSIGYRDSHIETCDLEYECANIPAFFEEVWKHYHPIRHYFLENNIFSSKAMPEFSEDMLKFLIYASLALTDEPSSGISGDVKYRLRWDDQLQTFFWNDQYTLEEATKRVAILYQALLMKKGST